MSGFFESELDAHIAVAEATRAKLREPFDRAVAVCLKALRGGGKLLFFGNGGSAADAQHLATELTIRYAKDRAPIAAIALTTDTSALTAAGNDLGFDQIFARQLEAIGKPDDVAIAISTSGRSANVLRALETAKRMRIATVLFTGASGGQAAGLADVALTVPSEVTARIQEMHITLGQMLCAALEVELGLVSRQ